MIIRIFIPNNVYFLESIHSSKCYSIFGTIVSDQNHENVSVFVIDVREFTEQTKFRCQLIGCISNNLNDCVIQLQRDNITFGIDGSKCSLALKAISVPSFNTTGKEFQSQLFLYDSKMFKELSKRIDGQAWRLRPDPISQLMISVKGDIQCQEPNTSIQNHQTNPKRLISLLLSLSMYANTKLSFLNSAFLKHCRFWTSNLGRFHGNGIYIWTVLLDVMAGITVMVLLRRISNAHEYLLQLTLLIVQELQILLDALKGSNVGLKLNVELNDFFIEVFRYHVDMWATFLVIIAPLMKYLFVPLTVMGCFGLSFQLSMLSDVLNTITLHSHCIYSYASIIYQIEINGLIGAWRIVYGRRKNILKDRIESYEYTNQQLYLSVIFFTALLFFMPTILVYYVVFAILRLTIFSITYSSAVVQRKLLSLPILHILKWCIGRHVCSDNFEVKLLDNGSNLFSIETVRTFPSWINVT